MKVGITVMVRNLQPEVPGVIVDVVGEAGENIVKIQQLKNVTC